MIYHAARACAVGGYMDLYKELDPLPEVHIAEEAGYAQRNRKGSQEIYQNIISQPVKFSIMNDYKRTVDISGRRVTSLNGDTAAYSSLEAKSKFHESKGPWVLKSHYFNITEDWGIDDHDCDAPETPDDLLPLLCRKRNIPTVGSYRPEHVPALPSKLHRCGLYYNMGQLTTRAT